MRICVFQSSYDGADNALEEVDVSFPDPAMFTSQHEFHHRYIHKASAAAEIDAAVAEGFDMYLSFMWGQHEDKVAGLDAIRHLETLGVPVIGLPSKTLSRSKLDFYAAAAKAGLPVPAFGSDMNFPVFVKPAKMCASMFIDNNSVCHDQHELDRQLERINENLSAGRKVAANKSTPDRNTDVGHSNGNGHCNGAGAGKVKFVNTHDDIVVQEYIPGRDYSVVVIEMGNTPVAQNPTKYTFPAEKAAAGMDYMAFDVKFHKETREELLVRSEDPKLFDTLRDLAERAWHVNGMHGSSWCNVDLRVRNSDGKAYCLEVNPAPTLFSRWECEWEDIVIRETFPGGHRALVNVLLTTKVLQMGKYKTAVNAVADVFDSFSAVYSTLAVELLKLRKNVVKWFDFSGTIFELASGPGGFGCELHDHQTKHGAGKLSTIVGNDISPGMVRSNPRPEVYKEVIMGPLQEVIMDTTEHFDHIVCMSGLQYLDGVTLSAVLVRMFQLARSSVTFTVDEIPESYNAALNQEVECMRCHNNLQVVEGFGVPRGWRLASRKHDPNGWKSAKVGIVVPFTVFRFEALQPVTVSVT